MPLQNGKNLLIAYKVETVFGVRPSVLTAAKQFRLNGSPGLALHQGLINPNEVRSDGQSAMGRMGSKSVTGSFTADVSQGTFDDLLEAVLRGTWSTGTLIPANPPVSRSFTFEQYEQDIDITTEFNGCRVVSLGVRLSPDQMATFDFGIMGVNGQLLTTGTSPLYTSPTLSSTTAMVATDAAISVGGVSVLDFLSCDFTVDLHGSLQPVIGSKLSPDVFTSNMTIGGTVTMLRRDIVQQTAFLAETEFALVFALALPSPATGSITITLPRCKWTDYSAALGNDNAMTATLPFIAAKDATKMIQITTVV